MINFFNLLQPKKKKKNIYYGIWALRFKLYKTPYLPSVEGHLWKAQWKEKPNDEGHSKLTMNS